MNYANPFGIFTKDQLLDLDAKKLERIKEQILLKFQLSDDISININGRSINKNDALKIFTDLQKNLDLHLAIFNNKVLLNFLEDGNFDFFHSFGVQNDVDSDWKNKEQIQDLIVEKLNVVIPNIFNNIDKNSVNNLRAIRSYTSFLDPELASRAYHKTYTELEHHISNLKYNYPTPFISESDSDFKEEITNLTSIAYYNCLKSLPTSFQELSRNYATWCSDLIIQPAIKRNNRLSNSSTKTLESILNAAYVAEAYRPDDKLNKIIQRVTEVLKQRKMETASKSRTKTKPTKRTKPTERTKTTPSARRKPSTTSTIDFKTILRLLLLLFTVGIAASRLFQNNKAPNNYDTFKNTAPYNNPEESAQISKWKKKFEQKRDKPSTTEQKQHHSKGKNEMPTVTDSVVEETSPSIIKPLIASAQINLVFDTERRLRKRRTPLAKRAISYSGDVSDNWHYKITKVKNHKSYSDVYVETDLFPTRSHALKNLISQKLIKKYKDKERDFIFHFTNPDFPKRSFHHRLLMRKRNDILWFDYDEVDSQHFKVKPRTFTTKKTKLRGTITQINTHDGTSQKRKFEVSYDRKTSLYKTKFKSGKAFSFNTDYLSEKSVHSNDTPDSLMLRMIYKNLRLVNRTMLTKGNIYRLKTVNIPFNPDGSLRKSTMYRNGLLKNYTTSKEDNVSYCSIFDTGYEIRYFIDNKKRQVVGMHVVIVDSKSDDIEVIEVFAD